MLLCQPKADLSGAVTLSVTREVIEAWQSSEDEEDGVAGGSLKVRSL